MQKRRKKWNDFQILEESHAHVCATLRMVTDLLSARYQILAILVGRKKTSTRLSVMLLPYRNEIQDLLSISSIP